MEDLNVPKLITLPENNVLLLNLRGLRQRNYGVSVKYYHHNDLKPCKRVDYNSTISINKHPDGWLIDMVKENIFFNQHEPDLVSEVVGSLVSKSIYPVQTLIITQEFR
jgi:hypothetical protein